MIRILHKVKTIFCENIYKKRIFFIKFSYQPRENIAFQISSITSNNLIFGLVNSLPIVGAAPLGVTGVVAAEALLEALRPLPASRCTQSIPLTGSSEEIDVVI